MRGMRRCRSSAVRGNDINVLITSAGRRIGLVAAFRQAAAQRGGVVVGADIDPLAPALFTADRAVRVPTATDPGYVPSLARIIADHAIGMIVPTIDLELPILAAAREELEAAGATVLISSQKLVEVSSDKSITHQVFGQHGFAVPRSWTLDELPGAELPEKLFVKPRQGSASIDTHSTTRDGLETILGMVENPIVQEHIDAAEITVDALLDFTGTPVHYVPRRRIRVLAGESIQGVTLPDDELGPWLVDVLRAVGELGGRGPMTLQAFLTDSGPVLLEVNPRFGGGFPLAHAAGARYPDWLLDMAAGATVEPMLGEYQAGLYMTRAATETYTTEPKW